MRIQTTGIFVNDQNRALDFYTKTLGFSKKMDVSAGNYRWLTVVSPEDPNGIELVLEPNTNPAARAYQEAIFQQSIRAIQFSVDHVQKDYQRLKKLGVRFTMEPTKVTGSKIAVLDDTCGNLVQLTQLDWKM